MILIRKNLIDILPAVQHADYFYPIIGDPIENDVWRSGKRAEPGPNFIAGAANQLMLLNDEHCLTDLPRNFFGRIELAFPIEDGVLRERIINEILAVSFADSTKARFLQPDGSYRRASVAKSEKPRQSQLDFMALAQEQNEREILRKPIDGKVRFPQLKLARSPFVSRKTRR